jgi:biotin-[acetyl-CoA-carboxylase] ligase BirA-like protein
MIAVLRLLSKHARSIVQLNQQLAQSSLMTLQSLAAINSNSPGLVYQDGLLYKLRQCPDFLDAVILDSVLYPTGFSIHLIDELTSTNDYAMQHDLAHKTIVCCNSQYAGHGRLGRSWQHRICMDIAASFVYHWQNNADLMALSIVCALAVVQLFSQYGIVAQLKWPNDVYVNKIKAAGILVSVRNNYVVIGIGLNNIGSWERNTLLIQLSLKLDAVIAEFLQHGFNTTLRIACFDCCLHKNCHVTLHSAQIAIIGGRHHGFSAIGGIIIDAGDKLCEFISSDISLTHS